jgi:hypothetical protein
VKVRYFISEIRDISAKFSFYQRNPGYISGIFILSAKSKIYQLNQKNTTLPVSKPPSPPKIFLPNCLKTHYSDNTNTKNNPGGDSMIQVKVFDYEHEKDLEKDMNQFLSKMDDKKIVDIKYHVAAMSEEVEDQIYCFSAMVVYRK